ncbi:metal ABC transporter solute-binding protein, Zn/Mn family [Pleurocapsa sp. FMAR1]|uniref:metal ABC transporter solute-binding protein, Zn/Mn family n=1 Tax=Pleurocapsa sp. FMAR1 TaxID=3040204 RepID=UPI0029C70AAF|nr:zinc ABC transporter substrate-binding protein [Pleurocapsa sp. FMAR1]
MLIGSHKIKIPFNVSSAFRIKFFKYSLITGLTCLSSILVNTVATAQSNSSPKIVATFLPIDLFTQAVVGDTGQVDILIAPGTEVHEYQATPDDAKTLASADVLVENGLGIEEFLAGLVTNAGNSQLQQIDSSKGITVIKEEEPGDDREEVNPHVWLDPVLAQQQVATIRDRLIAIDPTNADSYRTNAEAYIQQLKQLDGEFKQKLAPVKGCNFITFHDAFPYLARRYGLKQEAIVEIPEDSITPKDIQRVQQAANQYKVKALLTEPGIEDKRIQQISSDLNLPLEVIDPLESGETNPQYYFQVMRSNLAALERACK